MARWKPSRSDFYDDDDRAAAKRHRRPTPRPNLQRAVRQGRDRQGWHGPVEPHGVVPATYIGTRTLPAERPKGASMQGVIKRMTGKGFGFIKSDDGTEYFFHSGAVAPGVVFDSLREGERVQFEEDEQRGKGPRAKEVERA
jgi:CspA family cold shock protein